MSTVVVVGSETLGRGDDALGAKLMGSWLRALATTREPPDAVVFYNSGVRLLARGSPHLEALRRLDDAGVDLLACVTCLEHYALLEALAIGTVSNMREIVERTAAATKVLTA